MPFFDNNNDHVIYIIKNVVMSFSYNKDTIIFYTMRILSTFDIYIDKLLVVYFYLSDKILIYDLTLITSILSKF